MGTSLRIRIARGEAPGWLVDTVREAAREAAPGRLAVVVLPPAHGEERGEPLVALRLSDFRSWFGALERQQPGLHFLCPRCHGRLGEGEEGEAFCVSCGWRAYPTPIPESKTGRARVG